MFRFFKGFDLELDSLFLDSEVNVFRLGVLIVRLV